MTGQNDVFHFAYDGTFTDYRALVRARERLGLLKGYGHWLRYPSMGVIFLVTLWWLGALSAPWRVFLSWEVGKWILGLAIALPLIDLFFDRVLARWVYSRYAAADRPVKVTVDAEGVSWNVDAWSGRFAWSAARNGVVTDDYLFVFIGKLEAITLPRRGLAEGNWDEFLTFVTARMAKPPVRA
jgi:hypothetical protein